MDGALQIRGCEFKCYQLLGQWSLVTKHERGRVLGLFAGEFFYPFFILSYYW